MLCMTFFPSHAAIRNRYPLFPYYFIAQTPVACMGGSAQVLRTGTEYCKNLPSSWFVLSLKGFETCDGRPSHEVLHRSYEAYP